MPHRMPTHPLGPIRRPHRFRLVTAAFGCLLSACGGDDPVEAVPDVASVTVVAESATDLAALEATVQLRATARDEGGHTVSGVDFDWSSSNAAVAAVDQNGLVTAISNGNATIRASLGALRDSVAVTVAQAATALLFTRSPLNASIDQTLGAVEVRLADANAHTLMGFTGPITMRIGENPRGGSLGGQLTRDAVNGVASFPDLSVDSAGAGYTLVATADGVDGESAGFNVTRPSLYVGDYAGSASAVTVIDLTTRSALETITAGTRPSGVAITPDGLFAYVTTHDNGVVVVETAANTVGETIPMDQAETAAVAPNGAVVYAVNPNANTVSVIRTETNTLDSAIPVGRTPYGVAFTPDGASAYVALGNDTIVSVIETSTGSANDSVSIGVVQGGGIVATPDGERIYVVGFDRVFVISTETRTVVASIPMGDDLGLAAVTPDGSAVYVADYGADAVVPIGTATNTAGAPIPVGDGPYALTVDPSGEFVYVANANAGTISIVDVALGAVTDSITVGGRPGGLAVMPAPIR